MRAETERGGTAVRLLVSVSMAVLFVTLGAACGYPSAPGYQPGPAPDTPDVDELDEPPEGLTDKLVATTLAPMGNVVTDEEGWVLYRYEEDTTDPPTSRCDSECARVWPPAVSDGNPDLVGIPSDAVGLLVRENGTRQLTLRGRPLYRYIGDSKPGEFNGQGVEARWFVVAHDGQRNVTVLPSGTPSPVATPPDASDPDGLEPPGPGLNLGYRPGVPG
jgi:predicted lipoprotein with Yx(FWY)xxD motif